MEPINEMELTFLAKSSNESFARSAVASFVLQTDPTIGELADIKTAVSEAVTNSIIHGYRCKEGKIHIYVGIYENGRIVIKIKDKGVGIENIKQAMEPMFTTSNEERAGLGFAVMQSFMDKLKVSSTVGKGTVVTMEKLILHCGVKNNG